MAVLNATQRAEIVRDLMQLLSRRLTTFPVGVVKNQLKIVVDAIDDELDTAEVDIFTALPPGAAKSWLQANQSIGREFIELTERKRKEEL